jgi:hypothetical protein
MVSVRARKDVSALAKLFFRGDISGWEFEEAAEKIPNSDPAVSAAAEFVWRFYDDFSGEGSGSWAIWPKPTRRAIARWRLYLAVDDDPFPNFPGWWQSRFSFEARTRLDFYPFRDAAHLQAAEAQYLRRES